MTMKHLSVLIGTAALLGGSLFVDTAWAQTGGTGVGGIPSGLGSNGSMTFTAPPASAPPAALPGSSVDGAVVPLERSTGQRGGARRVRGSRAK